MANLIYQGTAHLAKADRDVLGVLTDGGASIMYICMSGSCGTCRVQVCKGSEHLTPLQPLERRHFPETDGSVRLACQAVLLGTGDVEVKQ
jgi:ferredoxin